MIPSSQYNDERPTPSPALGADWQRIEEFLIVKGADALPHSHGRTLLSHLAGTRRILAHWSQTPSVLCAGALHSVYGTDVYAKQLIPLTLREEVRSLVGPEAERLAYLFGVVARDDFYSRLRTLDAIPPGGLSVGLRPSCAQDREDLTAEDVFSLIILYMANDADQACAPDQAPTLWLARASRMGAILRSGHAQAPPIFGHCTKLLSPEQEAAALKSYLNGVNSMRTDEPAAIKHLAATSKGCPWIAEANVWRSYLLARTGDVVGARLCVNAARATMNDWGTAWDKRLSFDQWVWIAACIQEVLSRDATPALPPPPSCDSFPEFVLLLKDEYHIPTPHTHPAAVSGHTKPRSQDKHHGTAISDDQALTRFRQYVESLGSAKTIRDMRTYPGLSSVPWHDPARYPIVRDLEESYEGIRNEIMNLDGLQFHNEAERIERTGKWSVCLLFERGRKNAENCDRCPIITRIVEAHDTVRTSAGLIYISRMAPQTHIAAHRGPTNLRIRCHLGIQVPTGDCGLRVGDQTGAWTEGKCIVFDDSLEHEAWNHTDQERIVLIIDLWHPDLTTLEKSRLKGLHQFIYSEAQNLSKYWQNNAAASGRAGYD